MISKLSIIQAFIALIILASSLTSFVNSAPAPARLLGLHYKLAAEPTTATATKSRSAPVTDTVLVDDTVRRSAPVINSLRADHLETRLLGAPGSLDVCDDCDDSDNSDNSADGGDCPSLLLPRTPLRLANQRRILGFACDSE